MGCRLHCEVLGWTAGPACGARKGQRGVLGPNDYKQAAQLRDESLTTHQESVRAWVGASTCPRLMQADTGPISSAVLVSLERLRFESTFTTIWCFQDGCYGLNVCVSPKLLY